MQLVLSAFAGAVVMLVCPCCSEPRAVPTVKPRALAARRALPEPGPAQTTAARAIPDARRTTATPSPLLTEPADGRFRRFYDRLTALKHGETRRVRITILGDSHVAGEVLPARLRSRLQTAFGDGGAGFVLVGQPWKSYFHSRVKTSASANWSAEREWAVYGRRRPRPRDDLFSVAGISVHNVGGRPAVIDLAPRSRLDVFALDIHYLRQPRGGRLEVLVNGRRERFVFTVESDKEIAVARVELDHPLQKLTLAASHGEVRLFGVDVRGRGPGVVVDGLGLNGGQIARVLHWNGKAFGQGLTWLSPDLVVLAFGSNEIDCESLTPKSLASDLTALIRRLRASLPAVDCLVLGPPDQARFVKDLRQFVIPPKLDDVVQTSRRVALEQGCAFFDQRQAMGGPSSVFRWVGAAPPLSRSDHVHLYARGYEKVADLLFDALMAGLPCAAGGGACSESNGAE